MIFATEIEWTIEKSKIQLMVMMISSKIGALVEAETLLVKSEETLRNSTSDQCKEIRFQ